MKAIDRLKREAREACEWRGHTMSRYRLSDFWRKPYAKCKVCGASVHVDDRPPPNGIDIAGPAVALNCPVAKRWL
jgi:hypothetical protein